MVTQCFLPGLTHVLYYARVTESDLFSMAGRVILVQRLKSRHTYAHPATETERQSPRARLKTVFFINSYHAMVAS